MIVNLGPIPVFARRVLLDDARGFFFDLREEGADLPHRDEPASLRESAEAPLPKERQASSLPGVPAGARWAPFAVLFILSTLACGSRPAASPVVDPPSTSRGAVVIHGSGSVDAVRNHAAGVVPAAPFSPALDEQLAVVLARLEALDLAAPARFAAACQVGCLPGVAELREQPEGGLACSCRALPRLRVVSLSSLNAKAARLQAADRHSQDVHQEPGADEDTRAGLSSQDANRG